MADERAGSAGLRWAMAGVASLAGVALIAWVIASLIPQIASDAVPGQNEITQLKTACRFAGPSDGELCQRALRALAAIDEGRCEAALVQGAQVLAVDDQASPLARKARAIIEGRLRARCPAAPAAP
jgi:hypothetical protein